MFRFLTFTLVFSLSACATSYGGMGLTGGTSAKWVDTDTVNVKALGNAFVSSSEMFEMLLLKSSETGAEKGYNFFVLEGFEGKITKSASSSWDLKRGRGYTQSTKLKAHANMYIDKPTVADDVVVFEIEELIETLAPKYKQKSGKA